MRYASSWPLTIISELKETSRPRMCGGAISERYNGVITEALPTARPRAKRATTMKGTVGASATARAPPMNTAPAHSRELRRPSTSDIRPPASDPKAAPISRALVMTPSPSELRPKCRSM
ncbi:hypothetical protein SRIMM317S_06538 [Streptomyces rimosus subsp. rimosus]